MARDRQTDANIKFNADTRDALTDIKQLEAKVSKLKDLANQGDQMQGGLLSYRQVSMYRKILDETEQLYNQYYKKLERMDTEHTRKIEENQKKIKKYQEQVRNSQGGNKWGDVASPRVQQHHQDKLDRAVSERDRLNSGSNSAELERLRNVVNQMNPSMQNRNDNRDRIDKMHERNPGLERTVYGATSAVGSAGLIASIGGMFNYGQRYADILRPQELQASQLGQKIGYGKEGNDETFRADAVEVGLKNQYKAGETLQTQAVLAMGGRTDLKKLGADTEASQTFGRSTGTDPNEIANMGSMLQRMGAMDEGQMKRLSDMIGGAVAKNKMSGREEEMMRATSSLAQSVSRGLPSFSDGQFKNMLSSQVMLGNLAPELKGERGSKLLGTMDAGFKEGNHTLDVLMRNGNSDFLGVEGTWKMKLQQEEGISNPKNVTDLVKGLKATYGKDVLKTSQGQAVAGMSLSQGLGVSKQESKKLIDSGFLEQMEQGKLPTSKELEQAGMKDLAKKAKDWDNAESKNWTGNEAGYEKTGTETGGNIWAGTSSVVGNALTSLNPWVMFGGMSAMALGGSYMTGKYGGRGVSRGLTRMLNPNIGQQRGAVPRAGNFMGNIKNTAGGMWNATKNGAGSLWNATKSGGSKAWNWGKNLFKGGGGTPPTGGVPASSSGLWSKLGKVAGPVGTALSLKWAADAGDEAGDWLFGHSKGDIKSDQPLTNIGKEPLRHTDDRKSAFRRGWEWMSGSGDEEDKKKEEKKKEEKPVPKSEKTDTPVPKAEEGSTETPKTEGDKGTDSSKKELKVDSINVKDKAMQDYLNQNRDKSKDVSSSSKSDKDVDTNVKLIKIEHTVRVEWTGTKLAPDNEYKVSNSISDYFTNATQILMGKGGGMGGAPAMGGMNLSRDQSRE
jgi:hypothetical protein